MPEPTPGSPEYLEMVRNRLMAEAASRGLEFDESDMDGFIRNATYGEEPGAWAGAGNALAGQIAIYDRRAAPNNGSHDGDDNDGGGGGGGSDWFAQNAPSLSNYGAPPEPFGESYTPGTYQAPTWGENYAAPTMEQVTADPGYQTRLAAGQNVLERSAASRGSILSGGQQKALARYGQDYAANEYAAANTRAFDTYQQRYGQFTDSANRGLSAFQTNEGNNLNAFNSRYRNYQDSVTNRQTAERDKWSREMDLSRLGLDATQAGRPS